MMYMQDGIEMATTLSMNQGQGLFGKLMGAGKRMLTGESFFITFFANNGQFSLPIAGSGIVFLASAMIFLCSGALAELAYSRGDVRDRDFLKLTQTVRGPKRGS